MYLGFDFFWPVAAAAAAATATGVAAAVAAALVFARAWYLANICLNFFVLPPSQLFTAQSSIICRSALLLSEPAQLPNTAWPVPTAAMATVTVGTARRQILDIIREP